MIFLLIIYLFLIFTDFKTVFSSPSLSPITCQPIYVRWPRVKLNNQLGGASNINSSSSIIESNLPFSECQQSCTLEKDPSNKNKKLQCSAINYLAGFNSRSHICQLFSEEHVQHTDGYMEADDRYTFYWKFCVETSKRCTGEYAFTFFSDRYMLHSEVNEIKYTHSLEECLAECLNVGEISTSTLCRSVSFNRTDGGCHLSSQNQLSKPSAIHINNDPNYRIDYYENNCYNNSFTFTSNCEPSGIRITVDSLIPYTGALYGLYDFFSCRTEPKEQRHFELFFPYPNVAKNCSDSIRKIEDDYFLEVVLSTDGVEPLYFITADDLTYQARCPTPKKQKILNQESSLITQQKENKTTTPTGTIVKSNYIRGNSINAILEELANSATINEENRLIKHFENNKNGKKEIEENNELISTTTPFIVTTILNKNYKQNEYTKDIFSLPLYSVLQNELSSTEQKSDSSSTTQVESTLTTKSKTKDGEEQSSLIFVPFVNKSEFTTSQYSSPETEAETTLITSFPQSTSKVENNNNFGSKQSTSISFTKSPLESTENITNKLEEIPQIKTTTKRSINNFEKPKEFSFSTHLSFPPNRIFLTTGSNENSIKNNNISEKQNIPEITTSATILIVSQTNKSLIEIPESTTPVITTSKIIVNINEENKSNIKNDNKNEELFYSRIEKINESNEIKKNKELINKLNETKISIKNKEIAEAKENNEAINNFTVSIEATKEPDTNKNEAKVNETNKVEAKINEANKNDETTNASTTISNKIIESPMPPSTSTVQETTSTVSTTTENGSPPATNDVHPPTSFGGNKPPGTETEERRGSQREKVIFEVFHNGQPADAVVVGSRITLAFTPYFAIPPSHMSISGCQVEPIGSLYDWEKEPLAIVKDGCQADHVGLVCPPQKDRLWYSGYCRGFSQQLKFNILTTCPTVEGCPGDDIVSRTLGSFGSRRRAKRSENNDGNIHKHKRSIHRRDTVHWLAGSRSQRDQPFRMTSALQQQLILLGGDSIVRRRLIVVNSDDELRYYTRTGEIPQVKSVKHN
ncbi:hypothetical protein Mgra_00008958 [Meloidogyne graminicola]|uniref:Apple domain-containing protein n=1 Tax=Meloidogyne graminicola TaxID=189291 RepID=A0A8S9ZE91_9BILA|nr:hypothetical protein Mgra_00008958 [Meloidogyne graminicola]